MGEVWRKASATSPSDGGENNVSSSNMRPSSAVDLFILTFNCAKTLINVPVFSAHLHAALSQNATGLPDLVVLSLQEVAPMSYAFVGSYFLNPYYARFGEALNLASARILETAVDSAGRTGGGYGYPESISSQRGRLPTPPYTLMRSKNVGMTSILLFARDPSSVSQIQEAECGFGAADMGNKGAVGLRVIWNDGGSSQPPAYTGEADAVDLPKSAELTFVAAHLAAMEWNLKKRNANWGRIVSGLTFGNPRSVLPGVFPTNNHLVPRPDESGVGDTVSPSTSRPSVSSGSVDSSEAEEEEDDRPLLQQSSSSSSPSSPSLASSEPLTPSQSAALQDISIFKPDSHLFVAGDLNYRISTTTPPPLSKFPSFDPASPNHYSHFLSRDQLTQERLAGRTFHGMEEAPVSFGPTYKFDVLDSPKGAVNEQSVRKGNRINGVPEVPWKFASHRWPGWCDRILFSGRQGTGKEEEDLQVEGYDAFPVLETSDHRPVWFRVRVPLTSQAAAAAGTADREEEMASKGGFRDGEDDPRVKLPVPIDVDAWERRQAARRKEIVFGWTALLWSTKEGAVALATIMVMFLGCWWLVRGC